MQERALKGIKNINVSELSVKDLINLMIQGTSLERKARLSEIDTYQAKQNELGLTEPEDTEEDTGGVQIVDDTDTDE